MSNYCPACFIWTQRLCLTPQRLDFSYNNLFKKYRNFKITLLALSWEFPKLTISLLILFLSNGCPLIHGYSTNSLLCATAASAWTLLSTWLNSLVRYLFLMLHRLSGTVSLSKLHHQTHSQLSNHLSNLTSSSYPADNVCVCVRARVTVCARGRFDYV